MPIFPTWRKFGSNRDQSSSRICWTAPFLVTTRSSTFSVDEIHWLAKKAIYIFIIKSCWLTIFIWKLLQTVRNSLVRSEQGISPVEFTSAAVDPKSGTLPIRGNAESDWKLATNDDDFGMVEGSVCPKLADPLAPVVGAQFWKKKGLRIFWYDLTIKKYLVIITSTIKFKVRK